MLGGRRDIWHNNGNLFQINGLALITALASREVTDNH
jgi:hypothetical protein